MCDAVTTIRAGQESVALPRLRLRPNRPGPESQLVQDFLRNLRFAPARNRKVTVFQEPWLGGACPDIVLVIWNPSVTKRWRSERKQIQRNDLRVVHHLASRGPQTESQLSEVLGLQCQRPLERLYRAGLILRSDIYWHARPMPTIFATLAIIAIEAKISNWKAAIQQALLNTWFASDSYILLPSKPLKDGIFAEASAQGIGVLEDASPLPIFRTTMSPRSYVSWELNEWTWQLSLT